MYWEEQYVKIAQAGRDNHKIIPHLYQAYRYYEENKERLERMEAQGLLVQKTEEYEQVCLEVQGIEKYFLIQRRLYTEMRGENMYWEEQYVKIAQAGRDNHKIIPHLYQDYRYYKERHEKLVFLANNLIKDIPRCMRDAKV